MNLFPTLRNTTLLAVAALAVFSIAASARAATITVTTANYQTGGGADCSIYEAVVAANTNAAFGGCPAGEAAPIVDNIFFAIPGVGTLKTILVTDNLPDIVDAVVIDGTTQTGASCTTDGGLAIELTGTAFITWGIRVSGPVGGSTIRGLVVNGFPGPGISLQNGSNGNTISCNYIGTTVAGTSAQANASSGVVIFNSNNNLIGGTNAGDRNLISGNSAAGISITFDTGTANGNRILGNYIGTNVTGLGAIANRLGGVLISGVDNTEVGGEAAGAGNLISGNLANAVDVFEQGGAIPENTVIKGNRIGIRSSGTAALANGGAGIRLSNAKNTLIGGASASARNVISGNSSGIAMISGSSNNVVQNNYIGTNAAGTARIQNTGTGVTIIEGSDNIIGGVGAGNLISGNGTSGVDIAAGVLSAVGNQVLGNYIGTDVTGTLAIKNGHSGVVVSGADNTVIGNDVAGAGNLISGNSPGISITTISGRTAEGTVIKNNLVGTNANGTAAIPNVVGIRLTSAVNTTIGGTTPLARNVVSGNSAEGIRIEADAQGAVIEANLIGLTADGAGALANTATGISLRDDTVGGVRLTRNGIWSNGSLGIEIGVDGVSVNDPNDGDTGPNDRQNFPVLTVANSGGNTTQVAGTLNSEASRPYRLEFFVSPTADATGYGQGRFYLGSTDVTTDAGNNAAFSVSLPVGSIGGWVVSATATDLTTNETSEFSQARALAGPTAASTSIAGRVTDENGRPVVMAQVLLTDGAGVVHRAFSSPFGYYNFTELTANDTVVLMVSSKGHVFVARVLTTTGDETGIDFVGSPAP